MASSVELRQKKRNLAWLQQSFSSLLEHSRNITTATTGEQSTADFIKFLYRDPEEEQQQNFACSSAAGRSKRARYNGESSFIFNNKDNNSNEEHQQEDMEDSTVNECIDLDTASMNVDEEDEVNEGVDCIDTDVDIDFITPNDEYVFETTSTIDEQVASTDFLSEALTATTENTTATITSDTSASAIQQSRWLLRSSTNASSFQSLRSVLSTETELSNSDAEDNNNTVAMDGVPSTDTSVIRVYAGGGGSSLEKSHRNNNHTGSSIHDEMDKLVSDWALWHIRPNSPHLKTTSSSALFDANGNPIHSETTTSHPGRLKHKSQVKQSKRAVMRAMLRTQP